jgi:predicted DNA-binding transcriptional regulator YafY
MRTVDPLGMVAKQAAWYLVARSAEGLRTYRVSRMREAVALAVHFERPRNFNLEKYWRESTAALRDKKERYTAVFAMRDEGAVEMAPWVAMRLVQWEGRLPTGWSAYDVEFDSAHAAKFVALGMGSRVRVLGPGALLAEVEREIRESVAGSQ